MFSDIEEEYSLNDKVDLLIDFDFEEHSKIDPTAQPFDLKISADGNIKLSCFVHI